VQQLLHTMMGYVQHQRPEEGSVMHVCFGREPNLASTCLGSFIVRVYQWVSHCMLLHGNQL
jgi:hypothetical protein